MRTLGEKFAWGPAVLEWEWSRGNSLLARGMSSNLITNAGRIFLHTQTYGTSPAANGLNYIGLSQDTTITETASSTTLSSEISGLGLTRALGTVTLPVGSGTSTTVAKTYTKSGGGTQVVGKAALFTAGAGGTMCHVLLVSPSVNMADGDTLALTFTITTS